VDNSGVPPLFIGVFKKHLEIMAGEIRWSKPDIV